MKKIFVSLFLLVVLVGGGVAVYAQTPQENNQSYIQIINNLIAQLQQMLAQLVAKQRTTAEPVACTMEVKQCPDGSSVGRQGPRCEFKACPAARLPVVPQTASFNCGGDILTSKFSSSGNSVDISYRERSFTLSPNRIISNCGSCYTNSDHTFDFDQKWDFDQNRNRTFITVNKKQLECMPIARDKTVDNWQTYRNEQYGFIFEYPSGWTVKDNSTTDSSGKKIPIINIDSPLRYDLPGYVGVGERYRILISPDDDGSLKSIVGFGSPGPGQSPWNAVVDKNVERATSEYKIGQQIIGSFKLTADDGKQQGVDVPVITYLSSVKTTPETANGYIESGKPVYVVGKGLVGCTLASNCEQAVYVGGKKATIVVSKYPTYTSMIFVSPELSNGNYDLYMINVASGQKSNIVKVRVGGYIGQ